MQIKICSLQHIHAIIFNAGKYEGAYNEAWERPVVKTGRIYLLNFLQKNSAANFYDSSAFNWGHLKLSNLRVGSIEE